MARTLWVVMLLAGGCGGTAGLGDAGMSGVRTDASADARASCIRGNSLPPGCDVVGDWALTDDGGQSCPFGASHHDVHFFRRGTDVCLEPGREFQMVTRGGDADCSVVLSGENTSDNPSEQYRERWSSRLTVNGDHGSAQTQLSVSGGSNCMVTLATTAMRR